ncbi:MAG: hypothetical protein AB1510_02290 [Bacillota bacterium]
MNTIQKVVLFAGSACFFLAIAAFPVRYTDTIKNPAYDPNHSGIAYRPRPIIETSRVDVGATALRGLAIAGITAAAFAIAGRRKEKEGK